MAEAFPRRKAFESLGYERCLDESLESGFQKVALYGLGLFYTHAARQLANGKWTSSGTTRDSWRYLRAVAMTTALEILTVASPFHRMPNSQRSSADDHDC